MQFIIHGITMVLPKKENIMSKTGLPIALRWFIFVLAIGTLISAGIYLRAFITKDAGLWDGLRALMFFLLGVFFTLMYGENRGTTGR